MNYIMADVVKKLGLNWDPNNIAEITLADTSTTMAIGTVGIMVEIKGSPNSRSWQEFYVIRNCPKDILLGIPFCNSYHSIRLPFNGSLPTLNITPKRSRGK